MGSPNERFKGYVCSSEGRRLWDKLGMASGGENNYSLTPLSKKAHCPSFKLTESSTYKTNSWVVKFAPGKPDGWNNVRQEYSTLSDLSSHVPVPRPLYCSTAADERIVGAEFIIMEFVPGQSFSSAAEIPPSKIRQVCTSVIEAMAKLHAWYWDTEEGRKTDFVQTSDFWSSQVNTWLSNYVSFKGDKDTRDFFKLMHKNVKPNERCTRAIHGNMDISNFIFDDEYNVKAVINWRYHINGDPMVDVGYFLMMFLKPADYGYDSLQDISLLMGPPDRNTPSEAEMVEIYRTKARSLNVIFSETAFNYAKAVSCLRLITIVGAAWGDWKDHEAGQYKEIRDRPRKVIEMLTAAGQFFYQQSILH